MDTNFKKKSLTKGTFTQVGLEVHACSGEMVIDKPNLWWPHLMAEQPGHMMMVGIQLDILFWFLC